MNILKTARGRLRLGFTVVAVTGLALLAAGCGSTGKSSSASGQTSSTANAVSTTPPPVPTKCATKGGTLKILSAGDVDHIDPGAAYYSFTYEITRPTQRYLLYPKQNSTQLQRLTSDGADEHVHVNESRI